MPACMSASRARMLAVYTMRIKLLSSEYSYLYVLSVKNSSHARPNPGGIESLCCLHHAGHSLISLCIKIPHTSRIPRNVTGLRRACCNYCTLTENVIDLLTDPLVRVITAFASLPTGVPGFVVPPPLPPPPPQAPMTARLAIAIRATTKAKRR